MTRTTDPTPDKALQELNRNTGGNAENEALQLYNAEVLASAPGLREAFLQLLEQVPEPDDDATARIVAAILGAEAAEELDAAWDAEGMRDYVDQVIRVKRVHKLPSDYQGGLGVFLVCLCDQPHIGEEFILTTGSVSIVAQLVRAHVAGWLPIEVVTRSAETRQKYQAMHLELVRRGRRKRAEVIDQQAEAAR